MRVSTVGTEVKSVLRYDFVLVDVHSNYAARTEDEKRTADTNTAAGQRNGQTWARSEEVEEEMLLTSSLPAAPTTRSSLLSLSVVALKLVIAM